MYLFLFTVIPLYYFLLHELEKKKYAVKGAGFNFFCGALSAAVYCFVGFLVFTAYRLPVFSFESNFTYFFLYGTVFPVSCCVFIYLIIGKNKWSFKTLMFSDVVCAFYAVFLPYRILSSYETVDYFCLFILPVVLVSCLYILRKASVFVVLVKAALWKKIVFGLLAVGVFFLMPAVTETIYFIGCPVWLRSIAEIGTVLLAVGAFFLFRGDVSGTAEKLADVMKLAEESEKEQKKAAKKQKHRKGDDNTSLTNGDVSPEKMDVVEPEPVARQPEPTSEKPEKSEPNPEPAAQKGEEPGKSETDKSAPVKEDKEKSASTKTSAPAKNTSKKGKKSSGSKKRK